MLTFDDSRQTPDDPLKALTAKNIPDQIECGENNDYWIFVRRSTKKIELVSKQTGKVAATCEVSNAAITYGLSLAQISAARTGLAL
jgi:hypothetical protein